MAHNGGNRRFTELALPGTAARVHHPHFGLQQQHQQTTVSPSILAQQQPLLPLPVGSSSTSRGPPVAVAPPLPVMAAPGGAPPPSPGNTLDRDFITLAQPRPGIARTRNEYIDTPLRPPAPGLALAKLSNGATAAAAAKSPAATAHLSSVRRPRTCPMGGATGSAALLSQQHPSSRLVALHPNSFLTATTTTSSGRHHHHHHQQQGVNNAHQLPILTQPCVTSSFKSGMLKKSDKVDVEVVGGGAGVGVASPGTDADAESIICQQCRRCKCDACCQPRPLPSSWICGKKYQCSADTTLDYCSCMCCVKACFYHCSSKDYDDECEDGAELACADRPCSCAPHRRWTRWACLGALTLALPCLLCYWPMRGCLHLCQMCYTRYHSQGCRCVVDRRKGGCGGSGGGSSGAHTPSTAATSPGSDSGATPTKRLLDSPVSGVGSEC